MDLIHHCEVLLGMRTGFCPDGQGVIPSSHMVVYSKIEAAEILGSVVDNPFACASLIRGSISQSEDDRVRVACVQQLLNGRVQGVEYVLLSLLFDEDEEMVKTGIEGLILINSDILKRYSHIFESSPHSLVRVSVAKFLKGEDTPIYKLDLPGGLG